MILVTGATGLVGGHLMYALLQQNNKVIGLCRKSSNKDYLKQIFSFYTTNVEAYLSRIEWRETDLLNVAGLEEAFEGVTHVYHCAAKVSFNTADADALMQVNKVGTANVVNICLYKQIEKLVYVSSVAALGRTGDHGIISEKSDWTHNKHNTGYAKSKYYAELEVWRAMQEGLNAAIVNPGIIFGPGNWKEGSPALVKKIAEGFNYYTLGTNGFVDVRDVVEVMQLLMHKDISGERYVLVSENLSYKKVFEFIAAGLGQEPPKREAHAWKGAILWRLEKLRTMLFGGTPLLTEETARSAASTYYYENAKVITELDFEFRPMAKSIEQVATFYKAQQAN